jgi:hypothetical protein
MALRSFLVGVAAAALLAGTAAAQTGSFSTGGSTAGSMSSGGAATGSGTFTGTAPTQLLPDDGVGSGDLQRSLSGLPQQGGTQSAFEGADSAVTDFGNASGPIATTPTPLNAPSSFSGSGGTAVFTPTPRNAPVFGSTAVPPMFGTGVPPLSGDTGLGVPVQGLATGAVTGTGLARGGFSRSEGQILSAREAARLQQQLTAQQVQSGAQVIVLSGSLFQGTTDRPNVVVVPTGRAVANGQARGLTAQRLQPGQAVLQGTTEAPRVIALVPSPGNVLVVQGGQGSAATAGDGTIRAQIVELPAE